MKDFKHLNLDQTYQTLVEKINLHISSLRKLTEQYFSQEELISFDNVSKAFFNDVKPENILREYDDFIADYKQAFENLIINNENLKKENGVFINFEFNVKPFDLLKNTLREFETIYLFAQKENALNLNKQIHDVYNESKINGHKVDKKRLDGLINEYNKSISELEKISNSENTIKIDSLIQDIKLLKELPTSPEEVKYNWINKITIIGSSLLGVGLIITGLCILII